MSALLVVAGLVAAWQTTSHARGTWWEHEPREAVGPDENGIAEAGGLRVGLDQVGILESVPTWDEEVTPLDGHRFWHIGVQMDIEDSEVSSCEVVVIDSKDRRYEVGRHAPSGVEGYSGYPRCALPEDSDSDSDDVDPLQAFIVVIPADAHPEYIRVQSHFNLSPQYLELPVN